MKETSNQLISGMPGGIAETLEPCFQLDGSEVPCRNPFNIEDYEMAQKLIISAVGAALLPPHAAHRAKEHIASHSSEKVRAHLRTFYHQLERHHKVIAGLFLTKQLAQLHAKLRQIDEKEQKLISGLDSETAEKKKTNLSNTVKLSAAGTATAAIAIAATAPVLPTIGLAAAIFGGAAYLYNRQIRKDLAAIEGERNFLIKAAQNQREEEVDRAVQAIKEASVEVKANFEKSNPQAWQRFLKELGGEHAGAIMQLLREQATKDTEQGSIIFFRPNQYEFIPLKNIIAEFFDNSKTIALEQFENGDIKGALTTVREIWEEQIAKRQSTEGQEPTISSKLESAFRTAEPELSRISNIEEKRSVFDFLLKLTEEAVMRGWRRTSYIDSAKEIMVKTGLVKKDALVFHTTLMNPLMKRIHECSLSLHTHPIPPQDLEQAKRHMRSDMLNSKDTGRLGLMAAPIAGGFTLYFYHADGVMHIGDFKAPS